MASNFWVTRREITQNNGRTRPNEYENQISNNHLLSNSHFQTPQNPFTSLNNYNQGRYQNNNIANATRQPMVQFSFSSNNPSSFLAPARYSRTLPLSSRNNAFIPSSLPNSSRISSSRLGNTHLIPSNLQNSSQTSSSISRNTSLIPSYPRYASQNSSSNGVATGYQKSSRPIIQNPMNFRYSPYPCSRIDLNRYQGLEDIVILNANPNNNNNNPLALNDSNPHSRIDMNNYKGLNNISIQNANLPQFYPIKTTNLSMFYSSGHGNASFDSTMEHHVFNTRENEARRGPLTTSIVSFNEKQTQNKELLLFKDDKNTIPTRLVIEIDDSSDDEDLDLSLHL
ncbi:unnamed protein product [Vicia faba]|uniref:Uncharacterized protein n=1 Tax=Vicia faba TaxID=3906 RepID=A0AAV0YRS8_VICFA|nr:unnamed protein product [Vicia faba]